jgi:hypothetical protein
MLKIISSKTRECYEHAAEASSRAKRTEQAAVRKAYFKLERHWLRLARSYEVSEQVTDFTGELTRRLHALRQMPAGIPRVVCRHAGRKCGSLFLSPIQFPKHKKKRQRSSVTAEKDTVIRWRHGSRSAPDCPGSFNNQRQLGALVRFGKRVPSHGAGEAALGADRQTIEFNVTRGAFGTTL